MWLLTFDQIHEKPNAITWRPLALLEFERRVSLDNGSPPCDGVEQTCRRGISKLGNSPAEHKPPLHWAVPKTSIAYRALAGLANALVPLVARGSGKLAQGDRARRAALDQWLRWSTTHRDRSRPLLWVHAPSVGEGLQANAVLERLRRRNPSWQIVYSFFSPSAEQLATRQPVDYAGYLPYDTRSNVGPLLEMLAPTALVFTKLDLWPELSTGAAARGVKLGMIAATVSAVSRRGHPIARILTQPGYQALDRIGAVAEPDATRLIGLGARPAAITITGDPRFDSALERARAIAADDPLRRLTAGAPTLVAGSTWPADERVLLDAYRQVRNRHPDARLVLVGQFPDDAARLHGQLLGVLPGVALFLPEVGTGNAELGPFEAAARNRHLAGRRVELRHPPGEDLVEFVRVFVAREFAHQFDGHGLAGAGVPRGRVEEIRCRAHAFQ